MVTLIDTPIIVSQAKGQRLYQPRSKADQADPLPETSISPQQVHFLDPDHPFGQPMTDQMVWRLLAQDPYLEYKCENDQVYVISNGSDLSLIVPKDRSAPEPYPVRRPDDFAPAFRLLGWAFLGLSLAGLGTLLFAPLAVLQALQVYLKQPLSRADQTRLMVVLVIAAGLLGIAFNLNLLLLRHFLP